MHWKPHWSGLPPPATHCPKHCRSLKQPPEPRQFKNWVQQFCAMQSPHGPPGDGHVIPPQVPASHVPVQHSLSSMQLSPSILHCAPQRPDGPQDPLQQLIGDMHGVPSG